MWSHDKPIFRYMYCVPVGGVSEAVGVSFGCLGLHLMTSLLYFVGP